MLFSLRRAKSTQRPNGWTDELWSAFLSDGKFDRGHRAELTTIAVRAEQYSGDRALGRQTTYFGSLSAERGSPLTYVRVSFSVTTDGPALPMYPDAIGWLTTSACGYVHDQTPMLEARLETDESGVAEFERAFGRAKLAGLSALSVAFWASVPVAREDPPIEDPIVRQAVDALGKKARR